MCRSILLIALALAAPAVALKAQVGAGPRTGPAVAFTDQDPIGFLLEHRDSLHLADSQVTRLVQINLRFFRRKRALQMRLDSLLPDLPDRAADWQTVTPPGRDSATDARVRPLYEQLREVIRAARDTAYTVLSPAQRQRADSLASRRTARRVPPGARGP